MFIYLLFLFFRKHLFCRKSLPIIKLECGSSRQLGTNGTSFEKNFNKIKKIMQLKNTEKCEKRQIFGFYNIDNFISLHFYLKCLININLIKIIVDQVKFLK